MIGDDQHPGPLRPGRAQPTGYTVDQALADLEYVANTYANSGYRRPKSDGTKGGDGRIDIYLDSARAGPLRLLHHRPEEADQARPLRRVGLLRARRRLRRLPAHTPLENLEVTAAHEYYHATQFAYDIADDSWFMEATAAWVEDELYPNVNDNFQYLADSPITHPGKPIDKFGGVFHYGVWNFFRYMIEHYPAKTGALPTLLLQTWKNADSSKGPRKDMYSTQAINKALKKVGHTSMAEQFANYSAATRVTHLTFAEGAALNYPTKALAGQAGLDPRQAQEVQGQARPPDQRDLPVRAGRRDLQAEGAAPDGPQVRRARVRSWRSTAPAAA